LCRRLIGRILGAIRRQISKRILSLLVRKRLCWTDGVPQSRWPKISRKLRQLILIEEFKACEPPGIKTYIDEQKASTLHQAVVLADDYSLTHRNAFAPADSSGSAGSRDDKSATSPT